ncbi:MAG: diguanylate cyclase [Actinobacteria bacterium]|nr:MAG: diguanylate cyclase [Actinomycetota bacterium]
MYRQRGRGAEGGLMRSFKVKLVAYFVLLSLLPLTAAFWGFSTVAARAETGRVDARLQAGLRATVAAYQEELAAADASAETLARLPVFERALVSGDRRAIGLMLARRPNLTVVAGGFRVGNPLPGAALRRVSVVGPHGVRGSVIAWVPLDANLVRRLQSRSGLEADDRVILIRGGAVAAGLPRRAPIRVSPGSPRTTKIGRTRYRLLVAGTLDEQRTTTLGVLSPQARIDAANWASERKLLLGLFGSLLLVATLAYFEGRSIVGTIRRLVDAARAIARGDLAQRVEVPGRDELALLGSTFNEMAGQLQTRLDELEEERARLRSAIGRFSDVLGATHDVDQLRRMIVETAVEATHATGGALMGEAGDLVRIGSQEGSERIEVPLHAGRISFGSLMLFGDGFEEDDRMTAASLAAQAVVALENARLHRIVERQARVDGLTGLANRRHCEDQLATELARVERFGGPLALVLADLDNFKDVNDRFGHGTGDVVLREFAQTLEAGIRDVDLAGRWGGEEFVLILPGTDLSGAARVAERIRAGRADRVVLTAEGEPIRVTASFGVAVFPDAATAEELLAAADGALYQAKRGGKNRVAAAHETVARP